MTVTGPGRGDRGVGIDRARRAAGRSAPLGVPVISVPASESRRGGRASRLRWSPLRRASVALGLVTLASFMVVLGFLGYTHTTGERTRLQIETVAWAERLASGVELHVGARLDALAAAAEAITPSRGLPGGIGARLRLLVRSFPDLAQVTALDGQGAILASTGSPGPSFWLREEWMARGATATPPGVGVLRQSGPRPLVGLLVPARHADGQLAAGIVAELDLQGVTDFLARAGLGNAAIVEIRSREGALLVGSSHAVQPRESAAGIDAPDLLRAWPVGERVSADGVRRYLGAAIVRPTGWVVLVGRSTAPTRADSWWFLLQIAGGSVLAILIGLAVALSMVDRTERGLERLTAAMGRLAGGDLPPNVAVTTSDDLGALTESFNRVLRGLRTRLGDYKTLLQFEEVASASSDRPFDRALVDLLREIVRGMRADVGALILREPNGFAVRATVGLWGVPMEGVILTGRRGLLAAVLASRQVEMVRDTEVDPRADERHVRAAGVRSVIAGPLESQAGVIGIIELAYRAPQTFDSAEQTRFTSMIRRAVPAVEQARAQESRPDLVTRLAILKRRAVLDGFALPDEVALYLAGAVPANVRELEGCFTRLLAFCQLTGREVTQESAQEFIDQVWHPERRAWQRDGEPEPPSPFLAVVRRGASDLFEAFRQAFGRSPLVEVVWDRRLRPRREGRPRAVAERRRSDRRREPPAKSEGGDYMLVPRDKS